MAEGARRREGQLSKRGRGRQARLSPENFEGWPPVCLYSLHSVMEGRERALEGKGSCVILICCIFQFPCRGRWPESKG